MKKITIVSLYILILILSISTFACGKKNNEEKSREETVLLTISKDRLSLIQYDEYQLFAVITDNKEIKWSSSNDSILSVSSNGLLSANNVGTATITATYSETIYKTCEVNVLENEYVPTLILDKDYIQIQENAVFDISAEIRLGNKKFEIPEKINFDISNSDAVSCEIIDGKIQVKGKKKTVENVSVSIDAVWHYQNVYTTFTVTVV